MTEKFRSSVDGGGQSGALLTNLSKAFDCIDHELLITKLYAYGFDKNSLYSINSCLKGTETKNQNKFLLQHVYGDSFHCTSGFYFETTSF